jgi:hypothetical protein
MSYHYKAMREGLQFQVTEKGAEEIILDTLTIRKDNTDPEHVLNSIKAGKPFDTIKGTLRWEEKEGV